MLTKFYGAKETRVNQLERLEKLSLQTLTMHSFHRDGFTELSAHVSDEQLTATGRCRLVLRKLPESLRLALVMDHAGEFTDVAELLEKTRIGIQALQEQTGATGSYAKTLTAPTTQQACKAKRMNSSTSEDSQHPRLAQQAWRRPACDTGQV